MKRQRPARQLTVQKRHLVTPHMLRITLGGDALADFPEDCESGYVKLRLSEPSPGSDEKPVVRTYTVRRFDAGSRELDIDFVLHETEGPAADWARECVAGDTIHVMGPGPTKLVDFSADWFLLVGDMSALPAISANIEQMPKDAKGYALLEILSDNDRQPLDAPEGLKIRWIVNPHPEQAHRRLIDAVKDIDWLEGRPSIWVAGEFSQSLTIRKYLKEEQQVPREQMYASSYWQIGQSEDGHRVSKKNAAEN